MITRGSQGNMTIRDLSHNTEAVFTGARDYHHTYRKLRSMGLQKGTRIKVKRIQGRNIILNILDLGVELVIDKDLAGVMEVS
jgi:Fe2+ transport system protein FeoA